LNYPPTLFRGEKKGGGMKTLNVAVAFVSALACLFVGVSLNNMVFIGISPFIALGAYLLNKGLEQHEISRSYKATQKARQRARLLEEIHAPDFFE
ncbi:MAG: hypothetical protein ACRCYY_09720, partial [Trueperaceae bacterium]